MNRPTTTTTTTTTTANRSLNFQRHGKDSWTVSWIKSAITPALNLKEKRFVHRNVGRPRGCGEVPQRPWLWLSWPRSHIPAFSITETLERSHRQRRFQS
jgi:hypothetical protein